MVAQATAVVSVDPVALLDRHTVRRAAGVPTLSVLVGPVGISARIWRGWAAARLAGSISATGSHFPLAAWVQSVAEQVDLPGMAVRCLAQRAGPNAHEFLTVWRTKTGGDREPFFDSLTPGTDHELLRAAATIIEGHPSSAALAASLTALGESVVPLVVGLDPYRRWP